MIAEVKAKGIDGWFEEQLRGKAPDPPFLQKRLLSMKSLSISNWEILRTFPPPYRKGKKISKEERARVAKLRNLPGRELKESVLLRAVYSRDQVMETTCDFFRNHFNVYLNKGNVRFLAVTYERDVIRAEALGDFGRMLEKSARHPAMLIYLDNYLSRCPGEILRARRGKRRAAGPPRRPRRRQAGLNENYGREILELHTLGGGQLLYPKGRDPSRPDPHGLDDPPGCTEPVGFLLQEGVALAGGQALPWDQDPRSSEEPHRRGGTTPRDPCPPPGDRPLPGLETMLPLRRRRPAPGHDDPGGPGLPRHGRRPEVRIQGHSQRPAFLLARLLHGQGQEALRIRRERPAGHGRADRRILPDPTDPEGDERTYLRVPGPHGLLRQSREVARPGSSRRSLEVRPGPGGRQDPGRPCAERPLRGSPSQAPPGLALPARRPSRRGRKARSPWTPLSVSIPRWRP